MAGMPAGGRPQQVQRAPPASRPVQSHRQGGLARRLAVPSVSESLSAQPQRGGGRGPARSAGIVCRGCAAVLLLPPGPFVNKDTGGRHRHGGWRPWTRLARDHYLRLDSSDYSVHFRCVRPPHGSTSPVGKTNLVEHIPLGAARWEIQAEKEIQAYANSQRLWRRMSR